MAGFNTSKCRYLTTSKNPSQYYLDILKQTVESMASGLDESIIENEFNARKNNLIHQLNVKGSNLNSPKTFHMVAYYTFAHMWIEIAEDDSKQHGRPYALERLKISQDELVTYYGGFHSEITEQVRDSLYDTSTQALLSKPDQFGNYNVIDFSKLHYDLDRAINSVYSQIALRDPDLLKSRRPIKAVQAPVKEVIDKFDLELSQVVYNYNPKTF